LNHKQKERKDFLSKLQTSYEVELGDGGVETPFEKFNTEDAVVWVDPLDGT